MIESTTTYFPKTGTDNTEATLALAKKRAEELGINTILVATTKGDTGARASQVFKGKNLVVVTHAHGFHDPNESEVTAENRAEMERNGATILTCMHAFAGVSRAMRIQFKTYEIDDIVASVLRLFGQGMKVVVEIAVMAADAGLARTDEDVVAIAGTARGADTAVVIQPQNMHRFFDLRVKEVICKPRF